MTPSSPLGFGIVGTGMIARYHAKAIAGLTGARLVGVAGRREDSAREFARDCGASFSTACIQDLVTHPEIQVVCVTTPSGAHLEPALAAIRAGRHVVVEKPLEITVARVDAMIEAARQANVRLVSIFQSRFGEGACRVKAAVAAGRLGRLVTASLAVKWHRDASYYQGWKGTLALDGGGAVINQSIHGIDLLQWLVGLPEEIHAWKTRRVHEGIEAEDTAVASFRFADGALGTFEATTAAWPGWKRRLELCGEQGSIALEDDGITRWDFRTPLPDDDRVREESAKATLGSGASRPDSISHLGHQRQLQDLVDALREGRPTAVDGQEGRRAVRFVEALYASARVGHPIKL